MTFLLILTILATGLALATVWTLLHGDGRPTHAPGSHFRDPMLLPPSAR